MINRREQDPFYGSGASEAKTAGATRRSIPNFTEVCASVTQAFGEIVPVTLEGRSLAQQSALFSTADVVVSQHGAALANLIWAKPNTAVVEINPQTLPDWIAARRYFERLASCLGQRYVSVAQRDEHSPVEPAKVVDALRQVL